MTPELLPWIPDNDWSVPSIFNACQRSCRKVMFLQVSVCQSVQVGAPYVTIRPGTPWLPSPVNIRPGIPTPTLLDIRPWTWWWSLRPAQICSFGDPQERHLVVATETEVRTVSKRAIHILLEDSQIKIIEPIKWLRCFQIPYDNSF